MCWRMLCNDVIINIPYTEDGLISSSMNFWHKQNITEDVTENKNNCNRNCKNCNYKCDEKRITVGGLTA
jgi:hypothetical protein